MYSYSGSKWANVYTSNNVYDATKNKASIMKKEYVLMNNGNVFREQKSANNESDYIFRKFSYH